MADYLNKFIDKWIEDYDKEERGKGTHLDEVIKLTKPTLEAEFTGKKDMYTQKQLRILKLKEDIERYNIVIKNFTIAETVKVKDFRTRADEAGILRKFLEDNHYQSPYKLITEKKDQSLLKVYKILDSFIYRDTALRKEILQILTSDYQKLGNGKVGISENLEKIKDELSVIEEELSNSNPDKRVFNENKKEYEQKLKEYEEEKSTKVKELKKKLLEMLTNASCRPEYGNVRLICSDNDNYKLYDSEYDYIIRIYGKNPIEDILKNLDIDSLRSLKEKAAATAAIHASILKKLGTKKPVKPESKYYYTGQFSANTTHPSEAAYKKYEKARRNWIEKISKLTDEEKKVVEENPDRYKVDSVGLNSAPTLDYEEPTKRYSRSGNDGGSSDHQLYGHGHQLYGYRGGTRKHRRPSKRTRRLSSRPNPLHRRR